LEIVIASPQNQSILNFRLYLIENFHCHVLQHTFSHSFLSSPENGGAGGNSVQLAQILGRESLNTTAIYAKDSIDQLADATERLVY
jgi:site-specific recombinase XerD